MPWLRMGDTAANHPTALAVLEHPSVDERLVNEVFGFVVRCAAQSTAHLTDYVVNRGTAMAMAGFARAEELIRVARFAGYWAEIEVDLDDGQGTRTAYKLMDDPEFIHMRTREEIEWERQRKTDNSNPALIVPVRIRDGDACRYCGLVVDFRPGVRKGRIAGTYDHRSPGQKATVETYVVSCGACNAARGDRPDADNAFPLLPEPAKPYYSPQTVAWITANDWARRNGVKAPAKPAKALDPGKPSGNGSTSGRRHIRAGNGSTTGPAQTPGNGSMTGPASSVSNGSTTGSPAGNGSTTGQPTQATEAPPARDTMKEEPRNGRTSGAELGNGSTTGPTNETPGQGANDPGSGRNQQIPQNASVPVLDSPGRDGTGRVGQVREGPGAAPSRAPRRPSHPPPESGPSDPQAARRRPRRRRRQ